MTTTTHNGFELVHNAENGYASFRNGAVELTRFKPGWQWEFYTITQTGKSRGLPMFVRYLTEEEGARLSACLDAEVARDRLGMRLGGRSVARVG